MLDGVSLDQLRIFIASVDEGSFSAASRKLRRAQSVVSQTVSNLEQQIGVVLFDRAGRYPKLTAAGRRFAGAYGTRGSTMASLLAVEVSPRLAYSASRKLTGRFIEKWRADHPGGTVVVRDLVKTPLPFVDLPWIGGAFTPAEQHSPEMQAAIKTSDDLIGELRAADHIVVGTPMYNFSVPASLKAYIDHVVRVGVTVSPTYQGLLTSKKATIILATGGNYAPGAPAEGYNVAISYLRQILGFIGVTDVKVVLAGPTRAVDEGAKTLDEFAGQFEETLSAAAA